VCAYEGQQLAHTIPHELTRIVMFKYFGQKPASEDIRWIIEGLAVYEEMKMDENYKYAAVKYLKEKQAAWSGKPVEEFVFMKPDERTAGEKAVIWYARAGYLVYFLNEQDNRGGLARFLAGIKAAKNSKEAFSGPYYGVYKSLENLNNELTDYVNRTTP